MRDGVLYECTICGAEFGFQDEAEEHVVYNHDVVKDSIEVHDAANRVEPGGM